MRGASDAAEGEAKARQQSGEATAEAERAGAERTEVLTDLKDRVTL